MSWRDGMGQNSTLERAWQSLKGPVWAQCQALKTPSMHWELCVPFSRPLSQTRMWF